MKQADVLEQRVAALEGAAAAVAVSSGQAAQFLAIQKEILPKVETI